VSRSDPRWRQRRKRERGDQRACRSAGRYEYSAHTS
jgi:hypothetical protein